MSSTAFCFTIFMAYVVVVMSIVEYTLWKRRNTLMIFDFPCLCLYVLFLMIKLLVTTMCK